MRETKKQKFKNLLDGIHGRRKDQWSWKHGTETFQNETQRKRRIPPKWKVFQWPVGQVKWNEIHLIKSAERKQEIGAGDQKEKKKKLKK